MIVCMGNLPTLFFVSWDLARAGQVPMMELLALETLSRQPNKDVVSWDHNVMTGRGCDR